MALTREILVNNPDSYARETGTNKQHSENEFTKLKDWS